MTIDVSDTGSDVGAGAFRALLPEVRAYIDRYRPTTWPALDAIVRPLARRPLGPLAVLPLASCSATGGDPRRAIPVSAAWEVLNLAIRILDDLQDGDRPDALWARVGPPRAFNISAGLYVLAGRLLASAPWPAATYRSITEVVLDGSLEVAAGQDLDLAGAARTVDEYWATIDMKNGGAFALACAAGALAGTDEPTLVAACSSFGRHLGLALQLFDDFEGLWGTPGPGDLGIGKVTLPVIYGLTVEHAGRTELDRMISAGEPGAHATRVRDILDRIHAREFLVWAALEERDRAIEALGPCPGTGGRSVLTAYADALFADVEDLLPAATGA